MKRLGIYFYFNEKGWVGDYVQYYLEKLKEHCSEICVVVNEPLTSEGREKLEKNCDILLVRENKGFDSWAYKYALEYYGYEKIKEYDEVLLNNFTCYGPIYPFSEIFEEMGKRDCDFWGLCRHPKMEKAFLGGDKNKPVLEHIQSYFISFRNSILKDVSFKAYWDSLEIPHNYWDAVWVHEIRCTNYFENKGFNSSVYMDYEKYKLTPINSSILRAHEQHLNDRNPLVKRKIFYYDGYCTITTGHISRDVLNYIDKNTDYDINLIWQDLLKNIKMSELRNTLHLNYYLPTNECNYKSDSTTALILHVYYEDLVDYCVNYAKSMPKNSDIYVISSKPNLLKDYQKAFNDLGYKCITRECENRGRDVSAYLIAAADVYEKYDYICCMHDKKSKQIEIKLIGEEFSYHCFENNLSSSGFVNNVIRTFDENKKLGMLVPPTVNFGDYSSVLGNEISINQDNKKLMHYVYNLLSLQIPFDDHPVAPFGTMFWVRGKAFKSIFNHKWEYSDFPPEPNKIDGTILHAIERIYPMAVQNDGYYVGWLATDKYISSYLDNIVFQISEINETLLDNNLLIGKPQDSILSAIRFKRINSIVIFKRTFYKLLSKITFGKTRKKYKNKVKKYNLYIHS